MHAARLKEHKDALEVVDIPKPEPAPGEVVVKIEAASICGSDIHHLSGDLPIETDERPLTLGHEGAGTVADTGKTVTHVAEGDHVVVHYVLSCGQCRHCLQGWDNRCRDRLSVGSDVNGTFAEYVRVPARCAIPIPESVPFAWGSIAGCAVSTAFHAIRRAEIQPADTVAVIGTGGVGLHVVLFAATALPQWVLAVDPIETRRALASEYGADYVIDPKDGNTLEFIRETSNGLGVDVSFECSGTAKGMTATIEAINGDNKFASGTAVSVGAQVEPIAAEYWGLREGQIMVSGDHTRWELQAVIDLLDAGRIELSRSIADRIDLADIGRGIERVRNDSTLSGKLIVEP